MYFVYVVVATTLAHTITSDILGWRQNICMIHFKGDGLVVLTIGGLSLMIVNAAGIFASSYLQLNLGDEIIIACSGLSFLLSAAITRQLEDDGESSLMFVPVKYWPRIYTFIGVCLIFYAVLMYFRM